ncbi:demethylmenaquinone methyltransferase [Numidum massiliense]|uniref:demethylmenaquinone methyltransferase n=1 Tax=Numidum massiliense TaxID=1522315 RepID=UPI0006D551B8|nr:demethylmenaquinone methyltransferase [Numidum massiliense]
MENKTRQPTNEAFIHDVFESIAPKYDRMNSLLSFRRHKAWRKKAMREMNVQAGDEAIDVCCGTADWALSIAAASGTGKVVGLDFSGEMLRYGQNKVDAHGMADRVSLVQGNAMALPFEDNSFDYATIGFALRNVPDFRQVLQEMQRVVRPGGQVVSLELSKPAWPPFRKLYYFYFQKILPLLGKMFADRYEQYRWLPESLVHFPDYRELADIFRESGLQDVRVYPLTGGIAALHIGTKEA